MGLPWDARRFAGRSMRCLSRLDASYRTVIVPAMPSPGKPWMAQ